MFGSEASRTKSESKLRGALLQLASKKTETHCNDSGNPGHKNQSKYKDLSNWTQEIRSHQFSLSHPRSFSSLFFYGLSLRTFSLKASTPSEGVKLPVLGFYMLKASPSKERSLEPLEFKGVP